MKTIKQFKINAIAVMILGIIHILATPLVVLGLKHLPLDTVLCFAYMFVITGIFTIMLGWLQNFILKKLAEHASFYPLLKTSVVLVNIAGIGAVATMWNNPFAYLILLVALYECFLLRKLSKMAKELIELHS